jgi:hypothetical protein
MGGTCTNDGCVPTRVLAKAARLVRDAEQFADYGLEGEPPRVDFARLLNRTQRIVYEVQEEKKQLQSRLEEAGAPIRRLGEEKQALLPLSDGEPEFAIERVRDWLGNYTAIYGFSIPEPQRKVERYRRFQEERPELCKRYHLDPDDLFFNTFTTCVSG